MARGGLDPLALYDYLAKARGRVLERARGLTLEQYTREFPFGLKTLRHTLVELPNAEWTYVQRLAGQKEPLPPWRERPFGRFYETEFAPLEEAWTAQAAETRRALQAIEAWDHPLVFRAEGDQPGEVHEITATTGGLAARMVLHEVHHRAQAMAMLRQLGAPVEDLDYSYLTFGWNVLPA